LLAEPPSPYCAFFIVAAGVVAWLLRRSPRGLFLLGWTVAALTPAALASASLPIPVADRHLYLASAPLSIGAALLLADSAAVALLALLVVWWGLAAESRNGSFRHLLALGRQTAACGATNPHARAFLGYTLLYSGDFADAAATYAEADRMRPNDPSILNDLGVSRMQSGDLPGAEDALRRACLISPTPYELDNYANVLVKEGRKREAVEIFDREIALAPKFVRPYREAAFVLRRVDPERSAEYDRRADILSGAR
jgi:Flp pilus assembly protein TadD